MPTITARKWGKHSTYYADGQKLPGGSTLAGIAPKDLTSWYAQQAAEYAVENWEHLSELQLLDRVKQITNGPKLAVRKAADRGTECHEVMERLANGQKASTDDPTVLADAEAAVRLMDAFKVQPLHTEIGLANLEQMYAGTADLIASSELLGGVFLMDHKFGKHAYESHAIQLSAYAHSTHAIAEVAQFGPKGGKLKPAYELSDAPTMDQRQAFIIHSHDGVAELLPVRIDGWVWDAVLIACDLYWEWETRTGWNFRNTDSYDSPLGAALDPPAETIPF